MAQDMISNLMELVQPQEYRWPAAQYHANIPLRKTTITEERHSNIVLVLLYNHSQEVHYMASKQFIEDQVQLCPCFNKRMYVL